jgi:signal transduction histidine kinase
VKRVWEAVLKTVGFYAITNLLVLACTAIVMLWLLNRGLAPLRSLASSASKVSVTSWIFLPPKDARATRELAPLVGAMERVLEGLKRSFEQQRRFLGDPTHELKTGVAMVKSSLQLLGMKQRSAEEWQICLEIRGFPSIFECLRGRC